MLVIMSYEYIKTQYNDICINFEAKFKKYTLLH